MTTAATSEIDEFTPDIDGSKPEKVAFIANLHGVQCTHHSNEGRLQDVVGVFPSASNRVTSFHLMGEVREAINGLYQQSLPWAGQIAALVDV